MGNLYKHEWMLLKDKYKIFNLLLLSIYKSWQYKMYWKDTVALIWAGFRFTVKSNLRRYIYDPVIHLSCVLWGHLSINLSYLNWHFQRKTFWQCNRIIAPLFWSILLLIETLPTYNCGWWYHSIHFLIL